MSGITKQVARAFCEYCDWTQRCWLLRKHLYDDNPQQAILNRPHNKYLFVHLEKVLQEYWLHQVAKLHDRAMQNGRFNLTIEYIVTQGTWAPETERKLQELSGQLDGLSQAIRIARNRLLSHNDLEVILEGIDLGAFEEGEDLKYFESLRAFANVVHEAVIGGPYPFDDLVENDVHVLMSTLSRAGA